MSIDDCALIDSHCHPHFPPLGEDINGVMAAMQENNVVHALAVATNLNEASIVKQLAKDYPAAFSAACGIHPTTDEAISEDALLALCADEAVLAVGETGLDFYRQEVPEAVQRQRFAVHIAVARK